ncbi:MAG: InlB B-repeat-containing protein, partial [Myxococcaceae bacterium]
MLPSRKILPVLAFVVVVGACSQSDELNPSDLGSSNAALFSNGGFESGDFTSWTKTTELNNTGLAAVPPTSVAQLQLSAGGTDFTFTRTNAVPESQLPPGLANGVGVPKWPKFGTTSTVINEYGTNVPAGKTYHQGSNNNVNSIKQTLVPTYQDLDPSDGKLHIRFVLAPELEAAGHVPAQQPYFFVVVRNMTAPRNGEIYTSFNFANQSGVPWSSQGVGAAALLYTDWQMFDIIPDDDKFFVGDTLEVEVYASGCQPGGHSGSVYVDGFGEKFPGLSISKTAPSSTNIDQDITYTFTVQNNTSGVAANVVADEVLPDNTTFVSINAPGATCTTPAVGANGTVNCTYGWMNPGASATFTVTVHNNTPVYTGTVTGATAARVDDTNPPGYTANQYQGYTVYLTAGQGIGQQRVITTNTATRLNITPNWTTTPNTTTQYKILNPPLVKSTATAGTPTTLTDTTQNWVSNQWLGRTVTILSGTGANQQATVTSNTATQLTVTPAWTAPAVGSVYAITQPVTSVINGNYGVRGSSIARLLGAKRETKLTTGVVYTDLKISVTDGVPSTTWGAPLTYTIVVTNNGPSVANGAAVKDSFPPELGTPSWTCAGSGGGVCGAASGSGNINTTANLPVGASVTYTVNATVIAGSGNGTINNIATVTAPATVTEQFASDNSDSDQDSISGTLFLLTANKNPAGSGQGSITSSPAAISCGPGCTGASAQFATGTAVTLTAVAVPNNLFLGWSGACSGTSSTCTVTMTQAQTVTATFTTCGNSTLEAGEGCDDGNFNNGDGCDSSCKIETGIACNANPSGSTGSSSCASGICDSTSGAPGVCEAANRCGNSVLETGEGCDDGNVTSGDGCNASCKIETSRACNANSAGVTGSSSCASNICDTTSGAPGTCEAANSCGNSVLESGEGCDDGNVTSGDGCNSSCKIETSRACNANSSGATGSASCAS